MIARLLYQSIVSKLFHNKVIIVYGARQVGKTTLVKEILAEYSGSSLYINCDLVPNQHLLDYTNPQWFLDAFQNKELIVLDEAQNIPQIGRILKILVDHFPDKQFIATGSSSFDLANHLNEPLTGRNYKYTLYSLSCEELLQHHDRFWFHNNLESLLVYGSYPDVVSQPTDQKKETLNLLAGDYLYKDIFKVEGIKKSTYVKHILQLLALQIGNEVNYNEIGQKLGLTHTTVVKYIDILEQAFIIYRLPSFARNIRNEITKGVKIYFFDLGVRNSLIQNFNPLHLRQDTGSLRQNFLIMERIKHKAYHGLSSNQYFWRTYAQQEIDYLEEYDGVLHAYEFKRWKKSATIPSWFATHYTNHTFTSINQTNFLDFVR